MANRIVLNETSYFGPGSISVLPEEITGRNFKKALLVTDKDLVTYGVAAKVTAVLDAAKIPFTLYDQVKPNPTIANVTAGVKLFAESGADFLIGRINRRRLAD